MLGLRGFFRFLRLRFVKKEPQAGDITAFYFEPTKPLVHAAGQHSFFFLPGLKGVHAFSLASSPDEKYVMIATHVRKESKYKQRLNSLKTGEAMWTIGPVFPFTFKKKTTRYIFLAQGIGITPFRSMLVWARDRKLQVSTMLIHVDRGDHTFAPLISSLATNAFYPTNTKAFQELVKHETQTPGGQYYISGSPKFLRTTVGLLRKNGVKLSQMTFDGFLGY